jgi:hypothetical protein
MLRVQNGKSAANMSEYLDSNNTKEFIAATARVWGFDPAACYAVEGAGKTRRTMAHLSLAIHAAMYLDAEFQAAVIKEFIDNRLIQHRTESGDEFLALNRVIAAMPDRADKDNTGVFIQTAKAIKAKIGVADWNVATAEQLRWRLDLEKHIHQSIEAEFINTYADIRKAIDKFRVPLHTQPLEGEVISGS